MKNKISILLITLCIGQGVQAQFIVEAPALETMTSQLLGQQLMLTNMVQQEKLQKQASGLMSKLKSVKRFIAIIESLTCKTQDFSVSLAQAEKLGIKNCYMEEQLNKIFNGLEMAIDITNKALSSGMSTDPANRMTLFNDAFETYFKAQNSMGELMQFIVREVSRKRREERMVNGIDYMASIGQLK